MTIFSLWWCTGNELKKWSYFAGAADPGCLLPADHAGAPPAGRAAGLGGAALFMRRASAHRITWLPWLTQPFPPSCMLLRCQRAGENSALDAGGLRFGQADGGAVEASWSARYRWRDPGRRSDRPERARVAGAERVPKRAIRSWARCSCCSASARSEIVGADESGRHRDSGGLFRGGGAVHNGDGAYCCLWGAAYQRSHLRRCFHGGHQRGYHRPSAIG